MTPQEKQELREELLNHKPFLKALYEISLGGSRGRKQRFIDNADEAQLNILGEIFNKICVGEITIRPSQQKSYYHSRRNNHLFKNFLDNYDDFRGSDISQKKDIIRKVSCFHCLLHALFYKI